MTILWQPYAVTLHIYIPDWAVFFALINVSSVVDNVISRIKEIDEQYYLVV